MRISLQLTTGSGASPDRRASIVAGLTILLTVALIPVFRLQGSPWWEASAAAATFVAPGVPLGWLAWRMLMRERKTGVVLAILRHSGAALAFSAAWTLPMLALTYVIRGTVPSGFLSRGAVWQLLWGLVFYSVFLLAARTHQRLQSQERATAGAELQALRAQLDPHFLFNTLHSLTQLASEDPVATQDALQRFAELMRYVLRAGREPGGEVALEEELAFVRNFLALERLRLGDRLRVEEHIDSDALELAVPPLLLQPLVENAVRHGLDRRRGGGTLWLRAQIASERLVIRIEDDGPGADVTSLAATRGVGLQAVARQLQAHFPGRNEFFVESNRDAGFAVEMTMPARLPRRGPTHAHDLGRR